MAQVNGTALQIFNAIYHDNEIPLSLRPTGKKGMVQIENYLQTFRNRNNLSGTEFSLNNMRSYIHNKTVMAGSLEFENLGEWDIFCIGSHEGRLIERILCELRP
jgi:hypothetical protein